MTYFKIGDADFSLFVQKMSVDYQVLLSSSSGRNANGDNVVDIINRKDKLSITFRPMSAASMATLLAALEDYVVSISYLSPKNQTLKTISAYVGACKPDYYLLTDGTKLFNALSVNFVEM